MKIIHLSDLHIGKKVNEFSMIEDQSFILKEILQIVDERKPELVFIAGDIYDKSVPSAEAVSLVDFFLTQLSSRGIKTFIISGNHDSAERLAFGSDIMKGQGLHIAKAFNGKLEKFTVRDEYGNLNIYCLPFVKPINVKSHYPEAEIKDYDDAVRILIENLTLDKGERNFLLCHQFIDHASICESEERAIGGLDQVNGEHFKDFDYVALGHLHGAQHVGRPEVRYCGTPLKYSFSEKNYKKSVTLLDVEDKAGGVKIEKIPLVPLHDMREIKGNFQEVIENGKSDVKKDDYIKVVLTDEDDVINGMGRLRDVFPNIMKLEYDNARTKMNQEIVGMGNNKKLNPLELFDEFYELQNNVCLDEEASNIVKTLIEKVWEG